MMILSKKTILLLLCSTITGSIISSGRKTKWAPLPGAKAATPKAWSNTTSSNPEEQALKEALALSQAEAESLKIAAALKARGAAALEAKRLQEEQDKAIAHALQASGDQPTSGASHSHLAAAKAHDDRLAPALHGAAKKQQDKADARRTKKLELEKKKKAEAASLDLAKKLQQETDDALLARQLHQQLSTKDAGAAAHKSKKPGKIDLLQHNRSGRATDKSKESIDYGKVYPVPDDLTARHTVIHLQATQQKGVTCGYHSLVNAWAIDQLMQRNSPLTSDALQKKAEERAEITNNKDGSKEKVMLTMQEMPPYIVRLELTSKLYLLSCNQKTNEIQLAEAGVVNCFNRLSQLDRTENAYFVCNTSDNWEHGGHWFTVAIIKRAGARPLILVLDSMNWAITAGTPAYLLIKYICDAIT